MNDKCTQINKFVFSLILWSDSLFDIQKKITGPIRSVEGTKWVAGFSEEANQKYMEFINELFKNDNHLESIISIASFDQLLLNFLLFEHYLNNTKVNQIHWDSFLDRIKNQPLIEYEAFFPWPNWANFLNTPGTVSFFTWYRKDDLLKNNPMFSNALSTGSMMRDFNRIEHVVGIKCHVLNQDERTAWNFTTPYYERLLALFYSLLPVTSKSRIPADTIYQRHVDAILLTRRKSCASFFSHFTDPAEHVSVFPQMINMVKAISKSTKQMTWWERRFLVATTLVGDGRKSPIEFEQFLLCASGIEALAKMGKKNLTYQFTHHSACLLTDNKEDQMNIINRMSSLYDIRSDIVHGKRLEISKNDLNDLLVYSLRVLGCFFKYAKSMSREEEYSTFLNKRDKNQQETQHA